MASGRNEVLHPATLRYWPAARRLGRWARIAQWAAIAGIIVLIAGAVAMRLLDAPLRRELERRVNAALTGYTATIGPAHLPLIGLALDLRDVTVVQNSLPHPPVIYVPRWTTSVQWRALLSGALVADVSFTKPAFYVTFPQVETEGADPKRVASHGWQDA